MAKRITDANEITDLNKSYFLEVPQDKVIKDIDEIKDLNNSYIMIHDKKYDNKEKQSQTKRSNKKGKNNNNRKGNEKQKELSELKQEVENLKKKDGEAYMKAANLNLQIYSTQKDKNEQPIADENMQKQSDKAFDEWLKINSEYRKKLAEYNNMAERENKKKQQRKNDNAKGKGNPMSAFIKDQIEQQKNLEKTKNHNTFIPITLPYSIYGEPMIPYNNPPKEINKGPARISKQSINRQLEANKNTLKNFF